MAGSRTLKLSILADVADLRDKLSQGSKEVEGFGGKLADFGKKAGLAFAAAGAAAAAYAGKLLIDGVKSAIEDEKAQAKLAGTLHRVAGASKETIAATEQWISKQGIALGVTDDELRPALDRLARATGDVGKAQKLASLAMDISASSGKSLESVSNALAKAQEGNVSSLAKLTGGFDKAELKGKTLADLMPTLTERFAGAAEQGANTFAGKVERLSIAFNEAKETVGSFVLDAITPLVTNLVQSVIPALGQIATNIGENLQPVFKNLATFFQEFLVPAFKGWWEFLTNTIIPGIVKTVKPIIDGLFDAFETIAGSIKRNESNLRPLFDLMKTIATFVYERLAPAFGTILGGALKTIGGLISTLINLFGTLVGAITNVINKIRDFIGLMTNNPATRAISGLLDTVFGGGRAKGGSVNAGTAYVVGEKGAELFVPQSNGTIVPNNKLGGGVINNFNINVSGAIDREGVARQIVSILNDSFYRGTLGAGALQS